MAHYSISVTARRHAWLMMALGAVAVMWAPEAGAAERLAPDQIRIRVAVVVNQPDVALSIHGRYQVRAVAGGLMLQDGQRLPRTDVRATPEGILVNGRYWPRDGVQIYPARDATIDLNGQRVRGTVEIRQPSKHTLTVINHIGLEDYLRGVLSKEAPHYWSKEALRAMAIAARTYALYQRLSKAAVEYDVSGDVLSQVYGGKSAEKGSTNRAVNDTESLVLVYGDGVFPAFYHSTCGGMTEDGSVMGPYRLAPLAGGVTCNVCSESPFYRWTRTLTAGDLVWALKKAGRGSLWPVTDLRVTELTPHGRAATIRIVGGGRSVTLTGFEFRQMLGFERVRSTALSIASAGADQFILEGRGWGHGVGLCQWGTGELATRGLSAREILAFYYPAAKLVRLGETPMQPIPVEQLQGGR